jgi:hypothetical protein
MRRYDFGIVQEFFGFEESRYATFKGIGRISSMLASKNQRTNRRRR